MTDPAQHKPCADAFLQLISVVAEVPGRTPAAGVSLTLRQGEFLALIGPNGSGKSTLLRVLTGEYPLRSGAVLLQGVSLARLSRRQRARRIAILAQHDAPEPRLRVEEYVALGRIPHHGCNTEKQHRSIVERALRDTGLEGLRGRALGTLSGGELQRAALARAFAQTPQVLLLDEPTNHLDPLARIRLLEQVRRRGITTIGVLHDLALVEPFADRVAVLQQGGMVCSDVPAQALATHLIQPVFGMRSFTVPHPQTGRPLRCFEAAGDADNGAYEAAVLARRRDR